VATNRSIERTSSGKPASTSHVKCYAAQLRVETSFAEEIQ